MADVIAIVRRDVFEYNDREFGPLSPGSRPLPWDDYKSNHHLLDKYLEDGNRIFLLTVRPPGLLWLVAVYEDVQRLKSGWFARRRNRTRIIDISSLKSKLRFHTGRGLTSDDAKLGNSLQNPRKLTRHDIVLLERALAKKNQRLTRARFLFPEEEPQALEGQRIPFEAERYRRDPDLVRQCLQRDRHRCRHCGFTVSKRRFPKEPRSMSHVVHVHHIRPLVDGKRRTTLSDLLTLCPTCHAVAHALATSLAQGLVGLKLLRKYYRA